MMIPKIGPTILFFSTRPTQVVEFVANMVLDPDIILIVDGSEKLVSERHKQIWVHTGQYIGALLAI